MDEATDEAPARVKPWLLALLCLMGAACLSGCIPPYSASGSSPSTSEPPSRGVSGQPASMPPASSNEPSSVSADAGCAAVGLRIEEVTGIVGFPLATAEDVPHGCSYSTDEGHSTTTVEILRPPISTRSAFEETFAQLSAASPAPGKCAWNGSTHSAFTCTGAFGPSMQGFQGGSQSFVFLGDHTWQLIVGTTDPAFVPGAEAGAWKLAQEALRRDL